MSETENMNIPEAAVDAAKEAIRANTHVDLEAEHLVEGIARAALEAALPHMLSEAFEQGQKSGMRHSARLVAAAKIGRPDLPGPLSPNPYR